MSGQGSGIDHPHARDPAQIGDIADSGLEPREQAEQYRRLNRQFHDAVKNIARSPAVVRLARSLSDKVDFYITTLSRRRLFADRLREAHQEHEQLIAAIASHDSLAAADLTRQHLGQFSRLLTESLRA